MFNTEVSTPSEFPVDDSKRWSTDVCCTIVGAIFALTLFILACVFFSSGKCGNMQVLLIGPTLSKVET